jgi:hypothetical protein
MAVDIMRMVDEKMRAAEAMRQRLIAEQVKQGMAEISSKIESTKGSKGPPPIQISRKQ